MKKVYWAGAMVLAACAGTAGAGELDCVDWQQRHPEWIWCDDFESDSSLSANYFDVNRSTGQFGVSSEGPFGGDGSLKAVYVPGVEEAGNIKLGFGRSPVASRVASNRDFNEVYWRFYTKTGPNWTGNARKLTRATIFATENWAQAAIGHLWEDSPSSLGLGLDPVSGVVGERVLTTRYNDFDNLRWLGKRNGTTQIYSAANRERWFCVEVHMKLNTPGARDGSFTFWIDGNKEAEIAGLDWRGSYTGYGINAIMLENYVNGGFSQTQTRYMDNFVVSTARIGCQDQAAVSRPRPPTDLTAR